MTRAGHSRSSSSTRGGANANFRWAYRHCSLARWATTEGSVRWPTPSWTSSSALRRRTRRFASGSRGGDLSRLGQSRAHQLGDGRLHRRVPAPSGPLVRPGSRSSGRRTRLVDRTSVVLGNPPARRVRRPRFPRDGDWSLTSSFDFSCILALRRRRLEESSAGIRHPIDVDDLDVAPGALVRREVTLVRRFLGGHRFRAHTAQRRVLGEIASRHGVTAADAPAPPG